MLSDGAEPLSLSFCSVRLNRYLSQPSILISISLLLLLFFFTLSRELVFLSCFINPHASFILELYLLIFLQFFEIQTNFFTGITHAILLSKIPLSLTEYIGIIFSRNEAIERGRVYTHNENNNLAVPEKQQGNKEGGKKRRSRPHLSD